MTNSVDMCGDGSSRHSVGTHGMTGAPVAAHINAVGHSIPAFLPNVNPKFVRLWRKIKWEGTAHSSFSNSLSPYIGMPWAFSSAAVTPSPSVSVPVNVPS